jgi:hypothetical protein
MPTRKSNSNGRLLVSLDIRGIVSQKSTPLASHDDRGSGGRPIEGQFFDRQLCLDGVGTIGQIIALGCGKKARNLIHRRASVGFLDQSCAVSHSKSFFQQYRRDRTVVSKLIAR